MNGPATLLVLAVAVDVLGCGGHALLTDGAAARDGGSASATRSDGGCVSGAFKHGDGGCICQPDTPTVCDDVCTDTTTDPANCGACGNACGSEATCNVGACGPTPTDVVVTSPGCSTLDFAVSGGVIYWADRGRGAVTSRPVAGGASTTISSSEPTASLVLVSGANVFWVAGNPLDPNVGEPALTTATIRVATMPGGAPRGLVAETNMTGGILGLVASSDGQTLYYSAGTKVRAIPVAGGDAVDVGREVTPDANGEGGLPTALAITRNQIGYLTDLNGDLDIITADPTGAMIATCGGYDEQTGVFTGTSCVRIARAEYAPYFGGILFANGNVVFANDNIVFSKPMMTPTGQIDLDPQLQIATTGGAQVTGLAGDAGDIYFAAGDDGVVWKTPNATNSTASPIARAQVAPRAVVIDATWVYWSTGDCAIRSMPR